MEWMSESMNIQKCPLDVLKDDNKSGLENTVTDYE